MYKGFKLGFVWKVVPKYLTILTFTGLSQVISLTFLVAPSPHPFAFITSYGESGRILAIGNGTKYSAGYFTPQHLIRARSENLETLWSRLVDLQVYMLELGTFRPNYDSCQMKASGACLGHWFVSPSKSLGLRLGWTQIYTPLSPLCLMSFINKPYLSSSNYFKPFWEKKSRL